MTKEENDKRIIELNHVMLAENRTHKYRFELAERLVFLEGEINEISESSESGNYDLSLER